MTPRVVLIGIHGHGRVHLDGLLARAAAGTIVLSGLADRREPEVAVPGEFGVDGLALLDRLRPDIAVICTPIHTHAEFAERAMRAGAHLLLEKPPVTSLADHARLVRVAAETGRHVQVGFQAFGSSVVRELLDRRAELGRIERISVVGCWRRESAYYARSAWAGKRKLGEVVVADGALTNPFAHGVALALRLADPEGPVREVRAEPYHAYPIETDDTMSARIQTASGVPVTVGVTLCAEREFEPYVRIFGSAGEATVWYTEDRMIFAGEARTGGRIALIDDLIAHLDADPAAGALCSPLRATRSFTEVLAAVQHGPAAKRIPDEYLRVSATGRTIPGIEAAVTAAGADGRLFSELDLPWAR
jgi:predicted dehydrogenase